MDGLLVQSMPSGSLDILGMPKDEKSLYLVPSGAVYLKSCNPSVPWCKRPLISFKIVPGWARSNTGMFAVRTSVSFNNE